MNRLHLIPIVWTVSTGCIVAQPVALAAPAVPAATSFAHVVIDEAGPLNAWGKCAADLNGDGRPDLLVGGARGGGLVWYRNPGWNKHIIDSGSNISTDVEVADIDRDEIPDVIAIVLRSSIVWYHNPDWTPHVVVDDVAVHDLEVADFDRDGDVDIIARNQNLGKNASGATLFLIRQDSPDKWSRHSFSIPDGEGLEAADLDRDGDFDIVINGTWFENGGDLMADWPAHVFGPGWKQDKVFVATGELNGDGRLDVVLSPSEPKGRRYRFSWFEAPADPKSGEWIEHVIEPEIETVQHFVGAADFNLDGQTDIAMAAMLQGDPPQRVSIYLNGGKGASWTRQVIGTTGSHSMAIFDLDGSGAPSLFGANHQDYKVELWRNVTHRGRLSLDQWRKHGDVDVVAGEHNLKNPETARLLVFENLDGRGGQWQPHEIHRGEEHHDGAQLTDIDNDGDLDIVSIGWGHPRVLLYENKAIDAGRGAAKANSR